MRQFTRINAFIEELETKDSIDVFIERLEELDISICPIMDMEEEYCSHYKNEVEDLTGGYCTCYGDCDNCREKEWNEDLGVPVDKTLYCKKHDIMRKKHPIRLDLYCPMCKPHLEL